MRDRELHLDRIREVIMETNRESLTELMLRAEPRTRSSYLEKLQDKLKKETISKKSLTEYVNNLWDNIESVMNPEDCDKYYKEIRSDLMEEIWCEGGFKEYEEAV